MQESMETLDEYMKRTGATLQEAFSGVAAFGIERVLELLHEANLNNQKLVIFYKTTEDLERDTPSYKFVKMKAKTKRRKAK